MTSKISRQYSVGFLFVHFRNIGLFPWGLCRPAWTIPRSSLQVRAKAHSVSLSLAFTYLCLGGARGIDPSCTAREDLILQLLETAAAMFPAQFAEG